MTDPSSHSTWSAHAARMREKAITPSQNDIIQTALVKDRLAEIRERKQHDRR